MDFERDWNVDAAADRQQAPDPELAALAARVKGDHAQPGTMRTVAPGPDGVVVLPAGTDVNDIRVDGRNLVVTLPDGTQMVILDGAVVVPRIVIGDVEIPSVNLAALLIGDEPQPAAGPARSSGGNFLAADGDVGDPHGLGDLLPPTELQFTQPEEREILPIAPEEDDQPEVEIVTPDQPAGAIDATASVSEAGLPTRSEEPAGSDAASDSEQTTGTIVFSAADGPTVVTINGIAVTELNQAFNTPLGTLIITSIEDGAIGYRYTLNDNVVGPPPTEVFNVVVTDADGDQAAATLTISIIDDAPTAHNDVDLVAAGTYGPETGNVITGADTVSGSAGADVSGADGFAPTGAVVGVAAGAGGTVLENTDTVGEIVQGQYGQLTIFADGQYSYERAQGTPGGVSDSFTYTVRDGDGDLSSATLRIDIGDSGAVITSIPTSGAGTVVDESGLGTDNRPGESPGSNAPAAIETTSGAITYNAPDMPAVVTINGVVAVVGQSIQGVYGTLTIIDVAPGSINYSYTVTDNTSGDDVTDSFTVVVTDVDGDQSQPGTLVITIVDDVPTASDDAAQQATENEPVVINALSNDVFGADGVAIHDATKVTIVSGPAAGSVSYDPATGLFTFTPAAGQEGAASFVYQIEDGDGDVSQATVTIALQPDSTPTVRVGAEADTTVDEAALNPDGSNASSTAETAAGPLVITTGNDTVGSLFVNDVDVTDGGIVKGAFGTLTITGSPAAGYTYSYTLETNTSGDNTHDDFAVTVTDSDGDPASTTLTINIVDDTPHALPDTDTVAAGSFAPEGGNVITGVGATSGAAGVDTQGADGARVSFGGSIVNGALVPGSGQGVASGGSAIIHGQYGDLTLFSNGDYSYTRYTGTPGGVDDKFVYVLLDGDGDTSPATLTISIDNSTPAVITPAAGGETTTVYEQGLPARGGESEGSGEQAALGVNGDASEAVTGTVTFHSSDGIQSLTVAGVALDPALFPQTVVDNATGTLVINGGSYDEVTGDGSFSYTYTLKDNTSGDNTNVSFAVVLTDEDGDPASSDLVINIVDDTPVANDDTDSVASGSTTADGNVITGAGTNEGTGNADLKGADSAEVTAVAGATSDARTYGEVDTALSVDGQWGTLSLNADGSYVYTRNAGTPGGGTETFTYTLRDSDGDEETATLKITLPDSKPTVTVTDLVVSEAGLPNGTQAAGNSEIANGTMTIVAGDGLGKVEVQGINGWVDVTGATVGSPVLVQGAAGVLSVTSDGLGHYSYIYTLTANNPNHPDNSPAGIDGDGISGAADTLPGDSFAVRVTDSDNDVSVVDSIDVTVQDDAPILAVEGDTSVVEGATATGTWSQTVGADQPGNVTQVIFNGTPYALGAAINTGKGTLTVNADGSWTFAAAKNLDNSVSQSIGFTVKVTDADGDVAQDAQTISITDGANPTSTKNAAITVDEEALGATDATGTNPTSTAETSSDTVTFLAGSDNITGVAFTTITGITANVNGVAGDDIVWSLDSATQITGKIGGITAITLTLTPSALPITAGTSGSATVSVTISDNFPHPDAAGQNQIVITGVTVTATDTDNDVATATAQITVIDDVPVVLASSNILLSGANLSATGDFKYAIGADSRASFAANNSDLQVTMSGLIGSAPTTNHQVTWVSEDAHSAVFNIAFDYDPDPTNASNPLTHETGTLTFDKDLGKYTLTLDQQIVGYTTVTTSQTISKESYNIVGQSASQPEIVVSKLADQFFVRFTGGEEASGPSVTFHDSGNNGDFSPGETFVGSQAWVSISGGANGVSSDTLQAGEVLDMNFYTTSPGNNANPGQGTATASGMYLKLDGLTGTEDMVVVLRLVDPDDHTTTTRAIVVDAADIYKSSESNPYGVTFADGSDGVIIIESNDYNFGNENYVITGAQLLTSTETVTGTNIAIDLNRATGASGASTLNTKSFGGATVDNDVIKVTDIGIISSVTTTQVLKLDIDVTVKDSDGDTTATTTLTLNGGVPPIAVDLDDDGLEFTSLSAGVHHDYGGGLVNTAWVAPDDGLLTHATGGSYDIVFSDDAAGAASDLEGLRLAYDSNRDGVFDASDAAFAEFGVWQDLNSNGQVDAGEFKSLADAGISEIGLISDGQSYQAAGGDVTVLGEATFVRTDGSKGVVGDVLFATASKDSEAAKAAESTTSGFNQALVAASLVAVAGAVDAVEQEPAAAATDPQTATEAAPASTVTVEAETAVTETGDPTSLASTTDQDSDQSVEQSSHGAEDPAPDHSSLADGGDAASAVSLDTADAAQPELGGHETLLAQSVDLPAFDGNAAVLAAVHEAVSATVAQVVSEALGTTDAPTIDALLAALPGVDHAPVLLNAIAPEAVDLGHMAAAAAVFDAAMAVHEAMAVAHG